MTTATAQSVGERITVRCEKDPGPHAISEWDSLVERTPGTDVTQLSAWSAIRSHAGFSPLYLLAFHRGTLVGGGLVQCRRLLGMQRICYLPYGPVVDPARTDGEAIVEALADGLTRLARSSAMTFVQPPLGGDRMSEALLVRGFRPSEAGIAPAGSYRLDLAPSLTEIRGGFSKRLKSWTNRWESKGVAVRKGDDRDVPVLLELMARSAARQGFQPSPMDQLDAIYRELAPSGHAAVFIGEVGGRPVAADLVTMLADTVHGRRCGFDSSGAAGRLSVPAAVRWEIIRWAKSAGYRWLDFGGLPAPMLDDMLDRGVHSSDDWPAAHCSKLSFNGAPFRYPLAVELIRPLPVRSAYDVARSNAHGQRLIHSAKTALRLGQATRDSEWSRRKAAHQRPRTNSKGTS